MIEFWRALRIGGIVKRIKIDRLEPGDIILTASSTKMGKVIRASTGGTVSHAMICVQHGSIIDSTAAGVQAWNLQRELFVDDEEVFGFRSREPLPRATIARIVDFARSEIGARYSKPEAVRSVLGGPKPRNAKQFCSRLVARAYASVGISLVPDDDYCTPEDLRVSPLLEELHDLTETVTPEEIDALDRWPNPLQRMRDSQNAVLAVARQLDESIENFNDLDRFVREHPEHDGTIAQAYRETGYLDLWKHELQAHPYRYDLALMESISDPAMREDLRIYCIETIREAYSGGIRFSVNLAHYEAMQKASRRETLGLLINLYETLVRNDQERRETARSWLLHHHPDDVTEHMERIEPHTDLWFQIVDRVEPYLGVIARLAISHEQSVDVCSSCGDPGHDYRIINSAEAMPGVPSLRLCDDCVSIRRGFGEDLEPLQ